MARPSLATALESIGVQDHPRIEAAVRYLVEQLQTADLEHLCWGKLALDLYRHVPGVEEALSRIDEGSFGVCLHCEEDISPKRLAAVPWTPFCISCQEMADRNQAGDASENFDEMLVSAA